MEGKIKAFYDEKGYGFIEGDDMNDYFLHITNVENRQDREYPEVGQKVEFTPLENMKGFQAKKCILIR